MKEKLLAVAFIPARSGSKRIPHKNIKELNGHPLIAYAIHSARASGVFDEVIVSTDSELYASIAERYGARVPALRPAELADAGSPDIEWVLHMLDVLRAEGKEYDIFSIVRPTSPFRSASTIRRAWEQFTSDEDAHSLRAVEKCSQHPAKMWRVEGSRMAPVLQNPNLHEPPWHSQQYPSLPEVYVQNASLEIARTEVPLSGLGIAGSVIMPFVTEGHEGFDLNFEYDWLVAEHLLKSGEVTLPDPTP